MTHMEGSWETQSRFSPHLFGQSPPVAPAEQGVSRWSCVPSIQAAPQNMFSTYVIQGL